jgi:spermidine synthase
MIAEDPIFMKTLHRTRGLVHDLIVTRKGQTITLWSAAGIRHTVLDLETPHKPGLEYARNTLAVLAFHPDARTFLLLGLGGGSIPRMLLAARPEIAIDAVEIDPAVLELARRFFHLDAFPHFRVFLEDAAPFLMRCSEKYDAIILDAYVGETFPNPFATPEFVAAAANCLTRDGILVVNWMSGERTVRHALLANLRRDIGDVWMLAGLQTKNTLLFAARHSFTRPVLVAAAKRLEREIPFTNSLGRLAGRLERLPEDAPEKHKLKR